MDNDNTSTSEMEQALTGEVSTYWRAIIAPVRRHLATTAEGRKLVPTADVIVLPERVIFNLDVLHLAGVPYRVWTDGDTQSLWQAALGGRQVRVSNGGGLAISVAREPGPPRRRVPAVIPLAADLIPEGDYHVTLGYEPHGPVLLDIAGDHRAILAGGATGFGKTNLMQSIVAQLAAKHTPDEFQVAIVDTKEVDFGQGYEGLPHLFRPIAHDLEEAERLVGQVEAERLRRKALMAQGRVSDWRDYAGPGGEGLSLLLLVVDEAADFAGTQTMKTLVQVARKGRAFGISIVVGTQYPTSDVIDGQVKANLPTAIAFKTRTGGESRVILDRTGAQDLHRKGLALVFTGGEWRTVQTLKVDPETVQVLTGGVAVDRSALSEIEAEMVMYAIEELSGAFIINALYEAFKGRISKYALTRLARQWEAMGWLTEEQRNEQGHTRGRMVTDELARLAMGLPHECEDESDGTWIPGSRPVYRMVPAPAA
jgi:hypothetical protein